MLQSQRHRDPCGKLSKHCGCVVRINHVLTLEQMAEHTRQRHIALKRKYRREAGARLQSEIHAAAEAKRLAAQLARKPRHDAHVKHYKYLQKAKQAYAIRYAKTPNQKESVHPKENSNCQILTLFNNSRAWAFGLTV